jgi:hypothetical protein
MRLLVFILLLLYVLLGIAHPTTLALESLQIVGEKRFRSLTDPKWCGFDALIPRTDIDTRTRSRSSSVGTMSLPSQNRH